jgi:hypothetical protein
MLPEMDNAWECSMWHATSDRFPKHTHNMTVPCEWKVPGLQSRKRFEK